MASEYDQLTGTQTYARRASSGWRTSWAPTRGASSFIVGDGTTFPHCLQHQVANLVGSLDGTAPVLAGAAVEGPNGTATKGFVTGMNPCPADGIDTFAQFNGQGAEWKDDVQSFSNTEPAVDLTATRRWRSPARGGPDLDKDERGAEHEELRDAQRSQSAIAAVAW